MIIKSYRGIRMTEDAYNRILETDAQAKALQIFVSYQTFQTVQGVADFHGITYKEADLLIQEGRKLIQ